MAKPPKKSKKPKDPFGTPDQPNRGGDSFEFELGSKAEVGGTIPEGEYLAKVINVQQETSKQGNPMLVWDFVLIEGKNAGKEFKSWTAITESAMWKLAETLSALGLAEPEEERSNVTFSRTDAMNRTAVLVIEDSEYNSQTRSSVKSILPNPKGAGKIHKGKIG